MSDLVKGRQDGQIDSVMKRITDLRDQISDSVPPSVRQFYTPDRLFSVVRQIVNNPKVLECTPDSIIESVMSCARYGLLPGKPMDHAALIPYKGVCTFQIMGKGLMNLAYRTGIVETVITDAVHEEDLFEYERTDTGDKFRHVPNLKAKRSAGGDFGKDATIYAVYCRILMKGGMSPLTVVMTKDEIEKIRNSSRANDGDAWKYWYWRKAENAVMKRTCIRVPFPENSEILSAIQQDNMLDALDAPADQKPQANRQPVVGQRPAGPVGAYGVPTPSRRPSPAVQDASFEEVKQPPSQAPAAQPAPAKPEPTKGEKKTDGKAKMQIINAIRADMYSFGGEYESSAFQNPLIRDLCNGATSEETSEETLKLAHWAVKQIGFIKSNLRESGMDEEEFIGELTGGACDTIVGLFKQPLDKIKEWYDSLQT